MQKAAVCGAFDYIAKGWAIWEAASIVSLLPVEVLGGELSPGQHLSLFVALYKTK